MIASIKLFVIEHVPTSRFPHFLEIFTANQNTDILEKCINAVSFICFFFVINENINFIKNKLN